MTDKQHPDKFDWATELSDAQGHVTLSKQEAKEIGARLRRHHAELETLTLYKSLADEYGLSIFKDLKDLTTEIETLRAKLKTYEDLGDAGSDVQLLRMGYAAARLEIESLKSQLAAEFALQALVAAGHVSQELVDRALALPGAPQPAHSGEPVAWLDPWTGTRVTTDPDAYGKHGIPLVRQQRREQPCA